MPYLDHFGLKQWPFSLTPNRQLFFAPSHKPVLESVIYALHRGEPIVKVTGEVGTGKTLLCRIIVQYFVDRESPVAFLTVPQADFRATMLALCREFGLDASNAADPYQLLADYLIDRHAAGHRAVLVVDEAQALDRQGLETIRLLSNLETDEDKLLQIVLFAQPELDRLLRQYSMRQLTQRITFGFRTMPFDVVTGTDYIRYRVAQCRRGKRQVDIFTPRAMRRLVKAASGIPRVINVLADRALLAAYAEDSRRVERRHVRRAIAETSLGDRPRRRGLRRLFGGQPA